MSGRASLERDLLIVACAISAGIHAALVPEHLDEGTAVGLGFAVSAAVLVVLAVELTRRPTTAVLVGSALTLAGLLAAYAFAITTGVPVLHPDPEAVDGLALFTKAVEAAGLFAALDLLRSTGAARIAQPRTQGEPA